ncbi:ABC transporter permease [Planctomycetota bacterium]
MSEPTVVHGVSRRAPGVLLRVASVWFRHFRVYSDTFLANATPAVLEPVLLLLAVGVGVGQYLERSFLGLDYAAFMAPGILGMTSLYTAAFETTYGTFVRLRYQQTYEAMRATPLTVNNIFTGELFWCGTKGLFYATIVGAVLLAFGKVLTPWAVLIPVVGFLTSTMFGGISFLVTSVVRNMNHFQFYFTAGLTPLVLFSGLMFPVSDLPAGLEYVAYSLPMFHVVETFRLVASGSVHVSVTWAWICPLVLVGMTLTFAWLGVRRMATRLLDS